MLVIPAIDVSASRLARLSGGELVPVHGFDGRPDRAAAAALAAGADWLHVVDMDHAVSGAPVALALFRQMVATGAHIQASGGLVDRDAIEAVAATGVDRIVVGSGALADPGLVADAARTVGDRLAVGLELDGGSLRPRGRSVGTGQMPPLAAALDMIQTAGIDRVVVTAVDRVGGLAGPDLGALADVLSSHLTVIAAGGVTTIADVRAVADLDPAPEAVIVGSAYLEGHLDLRAAAKAASGRG